MCHWAAHIAAAAAVAVVINGPTKAKDVSCDDADDDEHDTTLVGLSGSGSGLAWLACHLNGIYAAKPGECPSPACHCLRHSLDWIC